MLKVQQSLMSQNVVRFEFGKREYHDVEHARKKAKIDISKIEEAAIIMEEFQESRTTLYLDNVIYAHVLGPWVPDLIGKLLHHDLDQWLETIVVVGYCSFIAAVIWILWYFGLRWILFWILVGLNVWSYNVGESHGLVIILYTPQDVRDTRE